MADVKLDLFFRIVNLQGADFAVGQAIKLIEQAVSADSHFAKFADVSKALLALDRSHSLSNATDLLATVNKWATNINSGIPAAVQALLGLLGDVDAERFVAWRILFCWQHDRDISSVERDRMLLQALGWMQQSVDACSLTALRNGIESTPDIVNSLGYNFVAQIKALTLDASTFDAVVSRNAYGNDAVIQSGADRYHDSWNSVDGPGRLPVFLCGRIAESVYTSGTESPLLQLGAVVAYIRHRTSSKFETLCNHILDNPSDFVACWQLVDAMRHQKDTDFREEIEALIAPLAFAGDRAALLEAASFAVRRGYHSCDKSLLSFALGALAIASGCREITPLEPNDNPVDTAMSQAGEYLVRGIMAQAPASERERVKSSIEAFMSGEQAAADERMNDENAEREAAKASSAKGDTDDAIDDEITVGDTPPPGPYVPKTRLQALRRLAQERAIAPESIRVVHSIGNRDVARDETKQALRSIEKLMEPMRLASMPTDLSGWRQELLAEFPHAGSAVDAIYGDLVSRSMNGKRALMFKPTLLVGTPGCGKSRLARRVAESLQIGYRVTPCGGVSDSHFGGVSRGWHSSHPSSPLDLIRQSGVPNPVLVLDEIEKSATSKHNGNFHDVLLSMLETETSKAWNDPFIQGPVNISAINWLATANSLSGLPSPLLDRMRIIHVDNPSLTHLPALSATILREIGSQHGHDQWHQPLDQMELNAIGRAWSRQPSIRYLRRLIEGALRAREQAAARH
ncbi:AAA family ATPase [Dongia sp.]|uniref:AAA family ATPase n=1 Tax=Dongia sp. TaxID=1977262 RepID=UPI0035B23B4F